MVEILICSKMFLPLHNNSGKFFWNSSFTGEVSTPVNLERWKDTDVSLLITTYADNKYLFRGKGTKKDLFEKIVEQFTIKRHLSDIEGSVNEWNL